MSIIGVDLGTTNSLVAVWKENKCHVIENSFGEKLTPSVVSLDDEGEIIVGKIAKERLISNPSQTTTNFKRYMGKDKTIKLGNKEFNPIELSSFIIKQLKIDAENYLKEVVKEAIISVPAYFDDNARSATKLAGELAGLKVERIINEPSAAALACNQKTDEQLTYLVFDFGGGTLDVSIVSMLDNIVEIVAVVGDNNLGGNDLDLLIAKKFCKENKLEFDKFSQENKAILIRQSELCKIALNKTGIASMSLVVKNKKYEMILSIQNLVEIIVPVFKRIEKVIRKAIYESKLGINDIDKVLLVGGSTKSVIVKKYLRCLLECSLENSISSEEIVVNGLSVVAGIKDKDGDLKNLILTDISPYSLGVNTQNDNDFTRPLFSPIIERNSVLPSSHMSYYTTSHDYQDCIEFGVFQGDSMYCCDNLQLGEVVIKVVPKPKGEVLVKVRFTYDINGILEVEIENEETNEVESSIIINENIKYNKNEMKGKIEELQKTKTISIEDEENKYLIARAERLYKESFGEEREKILNLIKQFNSINNEQSPIKTALVRDKFSEYLDCLENELDIEDEFPSLYDMDI